VPSFSRGNGFSFIFDHRFSTIPRAFFLLEPFFRLLSSLF
jgi:hypothetical protein